MFGRVRDFVRRHRGKLLTVGIVGGVAYAASRYARRKLRELQEATTLDILEQTKKQMHFETTQKTCIETTSGFFTSLLSQIDARFDTEAITAEIRAAGAASAADKMPLWNKLKSCSICKAFAGAYGGAMLSVMVRVQLNVIGGYMFHSMAGEAPLSPEDQEEYLAAMKNFVDQGFPAFCDELERLVSEIVSPTSLKDKLTFDKVSSLTYSVKNEIDSMLQRRLSDFLYPVDPPSADSLALIVQETRDVFDNQEVFALVRHLTQMGANEILDALAREWIARSSEGAAGDSKPTEDPETAPEANANVIPQRPLFHQFAMPFAKLLPLFAGFSPGTVLKDIAKSEQLKNFAANVYETFSVPPVKI